MNVVLEVASYKKEHHMKIFQASREEQVISRAVSLLENPDYSDAAASFMRHTMSLSRDLQKKMLDTWKGVRKTPGY